MTISVQRLRDTFRGEVFAPDDANYDESREPWSMGHSIGTQQ